MGAIAEEAHLELNESCCSCTQKAIILLQTWKHWWDSESQWSNFWLLPSMIFLNWIALFVYDYVPVDGCNFALSGITCCIYSNVSNVWQVCDDLFLKLKRTYLKQENYTITVWTGNLKLQGLLVSKHVYWNVSKRFIKQCNHIQMVLKS